MSHPRTEMTLTGNARVERSDSWMLSVKCWRCDAARTPITADPDEKYYCEGDLDTPYTNTRPGKFSS
jgi:hypothetical protein